MSEASAPAAAVERVPDLRAYVVERAEISGDRISCWHVMAEVEAEFSSDALRVALGAEKWRPADTYSDVLTAEHAKPGIYRVIERRFNSVSEFDVSTRTVLDIKPWPPEPPAPVEAA